MKIKYILISNLLLTLCIVINAEKASASVDCDSIYSADIDQCSQMYDDWTCGISVVCMAQRYSFYSNCSVDAQVNRNQCEARALQDAAKLYEQATTTLNQTAQIHESTVINTNEAIEKYNKAIETLNQTIKTQEETLEKMREAEEIYKQTAETLNQTTETINETTEIYNETIEAYKDAANTYEEISNTNN